MRAMIRDMPLAMPILISSNFLKVSAGMQACRSVGLRMLRFYTNVPVCFRVDGCVCACVYECTCECVCVCMCAHSSMPAHACVQMDGLVALCIQFIAAHLQYFARTSDLVVLPGELFSRLAKVRHGPNPYHSCAGRNTPGWACWRVCVCVCVCVQGIPGAARKGNRSAHTTPAWTHSCLSLRTPLLHGRTPACACTHHSCMGALLLVPAHTTPAWTHSCLSLRTPLLHGRTPA